MDPLDKAALNRLEKALEGRALTGFTGAIAGDVIRVAGLIPEDRQTEHVKALVAGAMRNKPDVEIWQLTEKLAHVVALAKG